MTHASTERRSAILTRRLLPLVASQACGGFNDNLVKNALVVLALFRLGEGGLGFSALAGALLIAPYILLSATGGAIADRMPKKTLIVRLKVFEIGLMALAGLGLLTGSIPLLLGVILGLGIQAALFGPVKYAILPEHLRPDELIAGNGAVEAATFVAIVLGTVAGGALILLPAGATLVAALGVAVAAIGVAATLWLPPTVAAAPGTRVEANLVRAAWRCVRDAFASRPIRLSILGLSGFWTVGATIITALPVVARDTLGGTGGVLTLFLVVFAAGVGAGSLLCSRLLRGEVSPRHVPFAAAGLGVLTGIFALVAASLGPVAATGGPMDLLRSAGGIGLLLSLAGLAVCGGIFSVPLYAIIQETSEPDRRASTIAANNIVNAVAMVAGAAVAAALAALGLSVTGVLLVTAALTLLGAGYIARILPQDVLRTLFRAYFETFHGVEVRGLENYRAAGDRLVIVANHLSFADACLIACYLPRSPTFAVNTAIAEARWTRPFLAAVDVFKVDIASPFAIKRMVEAVRDGGRQLMIFPEGRLTKTGALMKVYEGAGVVADKAGAKVLPISIQGLQFTRLGRMRGRLPMRWFPRLSITILPAVDLRPEGAAEMTPRRRREAVGRALGDVMAEAVYRSKPTDRTIFGALLDARDLHGGGTPIAEDTARQPISYDTIVTGAHALGRGIAAFDDAARRDRAGYAPDAAGEERPLIGAVGLMLPNANATLVAFMALQAARRVPAMLNFSAGADAMLSACQGADLATIVSSRAFVERAKLGKAVERMAPHVRFLWLEDLRAGLTWRDKLAAKARSLFARRLEAGVDPDAPALILFTSGSEGAPKGVVHSSRTLLANIAQISTVVDFTASDRVFSALPMFHSFGMTGGTLLPILHGVRTFFYPSPLHYRIVPALIYDTDATIAFGTDTFLNGWARFAHAYDFYAIRYVFAGAERVRPETKQLFAERFGVRVLEGYGATETAPALALNTAMHARPGTVGRFLPGVETRLEAVPGIAEGGQLWVRGPNVMLGYLRPERPGVIQPPAGGWYDTGDIVEVSPDRYGRIVGRVKRWANIAGEKVSLVAAEELAALLWPDADHAVVKVPDPKKGEALVLVTTRAGATADALLAFARSRSVAEIMVPRLVVTAPALPLLGTGKTDLPGVSRLADEALLARAAA